MPTLQFQSPTPGQVLSDWITLSLDDVPVNTQQVEYFIGYQSRGVVSSYPFTLYWNPATLGADGSYELRAIARDAFGDEIGRWSQAFTVNYHGQICEIQSPSSGTDYSGTVDVEYHMYDSQYWPAITEIYVDGIQVADVHTEGNHTQDVVVTYQLDSTRYRNGQHELTICYSSHLIVTINGNPVETWYNNRGASISNITISNSNTTVVGIRSDMFWRELDTTGTATMQCYIQNADGSEQSVTSGISFVSDTPSVASITSSGVITAHAEGIAQITISGYSRTNTCVVSVRENHNISHFGNSGAFLTAFDESQSVFMVAPFEIPAWRVVNDSGLNAQVQLAGMNTITDVFYTNYRNIELLYADWKGAVDGNMTANWLPAAGLGYHFYFTGDDMCRYAGTDAWYTLNWTPAEDAVNYMMTQTASLGSAIGVDVVDEANSNWGSNPVPHLKIGDTGSFTQIVCSGSSCTITWTNYSLAIYAPVGVAFAITGSSNSSLNTLPGTAYTISSVVPDESITFAPHASVTGTFTQSNDPNLEYLVWGNAIRNGSPCNPFIPNTAIKTFSDWMHESTERIPISWPALGVSSANVHDNWMGKIAISNGISDYASHYWDSAQARHTYPFARGIHEQIYYMSYKYLERQNSVSRERPQIILIAGTGPSYYKKASGGDFNPPDDIIDDPGVSAEAVIAQLISAAILGLAGVRIYRFDSDRPGRLNAGVDAYIQTGIYPSGVTQSQWRAVSYAANPLTKTLRSFLLGTVLSSPALGNNVQTAARTNDSGNMLMVLNITDGDYTVPVVFGSLVTGQPITKYRVTSKSISIVSLQASTEDTDTLSRGECLVYLFPFDESTLFANEVTFIPA